MGGADVQPSCRERSFAHRDAVEPDTREAAVTVREEDVERHGTGPPPFDRHFEPRFRQTPHQTRIAAPRCFERQNASVRDLSKHV